MVSVQQQIKDAQRDFRTYDRIEQVMRAVVSRQIDGIGSAALDLSLRRNTLVRQYDLRVQARAAAGNSLARDLGQVRDSSPKNVYTVVIDFGTPRTVRGVQISQANGATITSISSWTGAKFVDAFDGLASATSARTNGSGTSQIYTLEFTTELRTDRLMLTLNQSISDPGGQLSLDIPDLPTDLELRINDGPVVWSHPGPARPGPDRDSPSADAWDQNGTRLVPLADALNTLLADPLADDELLCRLVLTSKVPGRLALSAATAERTQLSYIHRIRFGNTASTSTDLDFAAEGLQTLTLALPASSAARRVEALRLTTLAKLPESRTLPPVGPDERPSPDEPGQALAEMALDSSHAAIVRLDTGALAQLSGVRLPLGCGADGAEIRVVLWQADAQGEPDSALDAGTSEVVTLAAAAGAASSPERWTSFAFKTPIDLSATPAPWAALVVSRGTVYWRLSDAAALVASATASSPSGADPDAVSPLSPPGGALRRGPASGPWRQLPALLRAGAGALLDARGRVRVTGLAGKTRPIAPLGLSLLGITTAGTELTPTAKGSTVTLGFEPPALLPDGDPSLRLISRVAGTLTLRDVELIWTETPPSSPAT